MANSRSNIYPVQLQGAELNLNKFDAEIKQYSGFNKNNSPFIGGCLSNLFTKTEENTTGSSDSVYVDDNGDVYEIKPHGFYKNGELLKEYPGTDEFVPWSVKELNIPNDAIHFNFVTNTADTSQDFQKFIYATYIKNNSGIAEDRIKVHFQDNTTDTVLDFTLYIYFQDSENRKNYVVDKIFCDSHINSEYNYDQWFGYTVYYRNVVTNKYYCEIGFKGFEHNLVYNRQVIEISDAVSYKNKTPATFLKIQEAGVEIPWIVFIQNNTSTYKAFSYYNGYGSKDLTLSFSGADFWNSNDATYYFCQHLAYKTGNQFNFYLLQSGNIAINNIPRKVSICCNFESASISGTTLTINVTPILETQYLKYTSSATVQFSMGKVNDAYTLRHYGVCYALKTSDNKNFWGVCDYLTSSVTLENNEPMFKLGALMSNCILVNNGYVSGITLPGGNILATDWNSIDMESISIWSNGNDTTIVYKELNSNKFILIKQNAFNELQHEGFKKLSIRNINGLLVMNINSINNCYRLSDGKFLTFAPAWNNRAPKNNMFTFDSAVTENQYYLASAINEYNLKDNASIILNPVPIITNKLKTLQNNIDYSIITIDIEDVYSDNKEYKINFYTGSIDSSEFLYTGSSDLLQYSCNDSYMFRSDLVDMPFPLDTNGNVQYSPSLFCETFSSFGNDVFIKQGNATYQLMKVDSEAVMSFYLGTLVEGLEDVFVIQGQYYGIINNQIFAITFANGVVQSMTSIVSTVGLQFCGNSPYMAIFFSKTNRCLYSFTGANVLNKLQFVDKISEIKGYKYNPATQSIFLLTDIGLVISSLFGMYSLESQWNKLFVYDKGIALVNDTNITWLEYYAREGFEKQLIELETCFYGMNNQTITINDCLYVRLFSEEHEEGSIKVTATTISNSGRKTEQTEFKIKKSDWDKLTDSIYLRYQPKEQRGLGISFSISSPFKIASLSIGSQADAVLIDKVSKGAINAPQVTSSNIKW